MSKAFRWRLAFLIGGMALIAGLMFWTVQNSWQRITQLERKLTGSHFESFRLAADFEQRLVNLNSSMLHFAARREPAMWQEFEQAGVQLNLWIDEQNPKLNTPVERSLLDQINTIYDDYLAAAHRLHTNQQPAMVTAAQFAQLSDFNAQSRRLLQLGSQLGEAHRVAEESFITGANQALRKLRASFMIALAILLVLVVGLGVVLYRDMIAPLRTKLVQSQVLLEKQARLASLGTLAAGIAHEIRNPLTSVKARLWTLDKHLNTPVLARQDAEIIATEISRLERIVQEVLQFARPSDPKLKPVVALELLQEVHSLMASTLEGQRIEFTVEAGPDCHIMADASHLKQVLINLVRNAAESLERAGKVTLRVRSDRAMLNGRETPAVILEISDNGRGITPEVEKHLFDPFFTTKETGTGLGLSLAARIVEKHGGNLQYQTRVGRGTTFGIVLPKAAGGASSEASASGI